MADVACGQVFDDKFRESFKYYKRRRPCPDLSAVVDFADSSQIHTSPKKSPLLIHSPGSEYFPGLISTDSWKAFTLTDVPGFIFIVNPFKERSRAYWASRCLRDYTRKPNRSNLDAHTSLNEGEDIWPSSISCLERRRCLLDKLRWVTLGYHHNWDTKHYSLDDSSVMPSDLCALSQYVARAVGYMNYIAEAAIVNFYPPGSTLAGHTDHSEFDRLSPIISFSFGCSAIFLIGGLTKSVKPIPVYVRDGDIIIMSEACRLFYHAVPRVFSSADIEECHKKQTVKKEFITTKSNTKAPKSVDQAAAAMDEYENDQNVTCNVERSRINSILLDKNKRKEEMNEIESTRHHFQYESCKIINSESVTDLSSADAALTEHEKDIQSFNSDKSFVNDTKLGNTVCEISKLIPHDVMSYVGEFDMRVGDNSLNSDWSSVEEYLCSARININVRQVFVR